jgi:hypothetical protein
MMPVHDAAVKDRKQPSPQWLLIEIGLDEPAGPDPYLEELDVDFTHDSFGTLRRPAFSEFGCGTPHCQLWLPLSRRVTQHRS